MIVLPTIHRLITRKNTRRGLRWRIRGMLHTLLKTWLQRQRWVKPDVCMTLIIQLKRHLCRLECFIFENVYIYIMILGVMSIACSSAGLVPSFNIIFWGLEAHFEPRDDMFVGLIQKTHPCFRDKILPKSQKRQRRFYNFLLLTLAIWWPGDCTGLGTNTSIWNWSELIL